MKNIYNLFRIASRIRSQRLKLLGIYFLHMTRQRYLGVFIDPILACNFRCRMCYFSDGEKRKTLKGSLAFQDIEAISKSLYHRALKLQIGCGAEPTLYKDLYKVVALGKQYKVPYISLTTNGNILTYESLYKLVATGLDELTLSMHGVKKDTYEYMMVNGKYEKFCALIDATIKVKQQYPGFKLRINYTMNGDNVEELSQLFDIFPDLPVDILQLRPIQNIGNTVYSNYSLEKLFSYFESVIRPLHDECVRRGIICISPTKENLNVLQSKETSDMISDVTYCYISPDICWKEDFDYRTQNFEQYSRKHHLGWSLIKKICFPFKRTKVNKTRKMNYTVE